MPTVLNLRYPPIFRVGFLGKLSFLRFNVFSLLKIDCLASTSIHHKFLATAFTPVIIICLLQLNLLLKKRRIKKGEFLIGKSAVVRQCAKLEANVVGQCMAAVFFLYPMLNTTGDYLLQHSFAVIVCIERIDNNLLGAVQYFVCFCAGN